MKAERGITKHFGILAEEDKEKVVDGRTVWSRVLFDLAALKPGGKLSAGYWKKIRRDYGINKHPIRDFKMNIKEKLCPALIAAVKLADSAHNTAKKLNPLTQWCDHTTSVSRREYLVVLGFASELSPSTSENAGLLIKSIMKMTVRLRLNHHYSDLASCAADIFDDALCAMWACLRKGSKNIYTFWPLVRPYAGLVLSVDKMDRVIRSKGKWGSARAEVRELMVESDIARMLLGFVEALLCSEDYGAFCDDMITKLPAHIDDAVEKAYIDACDRERTRLDHKSLNFGRRNIKLKYRGCLPYVFTVYSAGEESGIRLANFKKGVGAAIGQIPELDWEVDLVAEVGQQGGLGNYTIEQVRENSLISKRLCHVFFVFCEG
jgi:hypothetical protein